MKTIKQLFLILIILSLCFLFSCKSTNEEKPDEPDEPKHVHTYSNEWTFDSERHFKKATCGHKGLIKDEGKHTFLENYKCIICGFLKFTFANDINKGGQSYVLEVGQAITPVAYYGGSILSFTFESTNPEVASVSLRCEVHALSVGSTYIKAYYKGVLESTILVEVKEAKEKEYYEETIVPDFEAAQELLELLNSFNGYKEYSMETYLSINNQESSLKMKYKEKPLYLEIEGQNTGDKFDNNLTIIKEENNALFMYSDIQDGHCTKSSIEAFSLDDYVNSEIDIYDLDLLSDKMEVTKMDNDYYWLKVKVRDCEFDISNLLGESDEDTIEALKRVVLVFSIKREGNKLSIVISARLAYDASHTTSLPMKIRIYYTFAPIQEYDLSNIE